MKSLKAFFAPNASAGIIPISQVPQSPMQPIIPVPEIGPAVRAPVYFDRKSGDDPRWFIPWRRAYLGA